MKVLFFLFSALCFISFCFGLSEVEHLKRQLKEAEQQKREFVKHLVEFKNQIEVLKDPNSFNKRGLVGCTTATSRFTAEITLPCSGLLGLVTDLATGNLPNSLDSVCSSLTRCTDAIKGQVENVLTECAGSLGSSAYESFQDQFKKLTAFCVQVDGEYCVLKLLDSSFYSAIPSSFDITTINFDGILDTICHPCISALVNAWVPDDSLNFIDLVCIQVNDKYCVLDLPTLIGDITVNGTFNYEIICDPCVVAFQNKALSLLPDAVLNLGISFEQVCTRDPSGKLCLESIVPAVTGANFRCQDLLTQGTCSMECMSDLQSLIDSAGCCFSFLPRILASPDLGSTITQNCQLTLPQACEMGRISGNWFLSNLDSAWASSNSAALFAALKKDLASAIGINTDSITVDGVNSGDGGSVASFSIDVDSKDLANTLGSKAINDVALVESNQLELASRIEKTTPVSVDSSKSTVSINGEGEDSSSSNLAVSVFILSVASLFFF